MKLLIGFVIEFNLKKNKDAGGRLREIGREMASMKSISIDGTHLTDFADSIESIRSIVRRANACSRKRKK